MPGWEKDQRQVCANGHTVTYFFKNVPSSRSNFCDVCGAGTMAACPDCELPLEGCFYWTGVDPLWSGSDDYYQSYVPVLPRFCRNCGLGFEWAKNEDAAEGPSPAQVMTIVAPDLKAILDRFLHFADQLAKAPHAKAKIPSLALANEYDLQHVLHAVLLLLFADVRTEEWTPSYAGGASRMDFIIKEIRTVIETKFVREDMSDSSLGTELLADIARYKGHPHCETLHCLVYDPGKRLKNPKGLENDLSQDKGPRVIVTIVR